jgi:hypothetical protein
MQLIRSRKPTLIFYILNFNKEVKILSEKRYWFRVYDVKFEERIEKQYSKMKKQFASKNDFVMTCFDYGLTMLESSDKLKIEEFLKTQDFLTNQKVNQVMIGNVYDLLEYISLKLGIDKETVKILRSNYLPIWVKEMKEEIKKKVVN